MPTYSAIAMAVFLLVAGACANEASDPAGEASAVGAGEAAEREAGSASSTTRREALERRMGDGEAARVFARVLDSIAPNDGWARTRYLAFERISGSGVRRIHRWDRYEGRYWLRAPVGDEELVALFNVNAPTEGERIWLDGERVTDEARSDSLATRAHAWFINDTYWLVFPFKWADPGVTTRYLGEMEEWGERWEVVELTFDNVGLTPQNRYRAFVAPESGMFELWQHYRNAEDEEPRFTNRWTDWRPYGPILLSSRREGEDGEVGVYFENLAASTDVPPGAFATP